MNKVSEKLRRLADGLDKSIENMRRPMTQNSTPKRNREYRSRLHDADNWERTQQALRVLADAHEAGTVPSVLCQVDSKTAVFSLVRKGLDGGGYYDVIPSKDYCCKDEQGRALQKMLETKAETPEERTTREARERARNISELEEKLRFANVPGFFPTPKPLAAEIVRRANIKAGHTVLEPSAGKGDLADAVREDEPEAVITTIERLHSAAEVLRAKGYNVAGDDFLAFNNGGFDRIVMNPPFEKGQDIDHVRHAYAQLNPGGKLVALVSEGSFFRKDRKATEFREWLEEIGGVSEPTAKGAFEGVKAWRQTGTASRIVEIVREGRAVPPAPVEAKPEPVSISSATNEEAKTDKPKAKAAPLKPKRPTEKAVLLREKLQALAARGVDGEATSAQAKLDRLEKRYDFTVKIRVQKDIFSGVKITSDGTARRVLTITDQETANAAKWALEGATGVQCGFRGADLVANASEASAAKLAAIATGIVGAVERLWEQMRRAPGIELADRALFIRGLLDGILNEQHTQGEALPRQTASRKLAKPGKKAVSRPAGVSLHPWSVAYPLGKEIRFSTDIEDVSNRLNAAIVAALPQ